MPDCDFVVLRLLAFSMFCRVPSLRVWMLFKRSTVFVLFLCDAKLRNVAKMRGLLFLNSYFFRLFKLEYRFLRYSNNGLSYAPLCPGPILWLHGNLLLTTNGPNSERRKHILWESYVSKTRTQGMVPVEMFKPRKMR